MFENEEVKGVYYIALHVSHFCAIKIFLRWANAGENIVY